MKYTVALAAAGTYGQEHEYPYLYRLCSSDSPHQQVATFALLASPLARPAQIDLPCGWSRRPVLTGLPYEWSARQRQVERNGLRPLRGPEIGVAVIAVVDSH